MTTDTDKIEELARWFDDAVYLVGNKDKAEFLRSLSIELTEWKIRCAELEQNAEHIQSSDEAEDLKRALADCSAELTELRQVKESLDWLVQNFPITAMTVIACAQGCPPYLKSRLEEKK
ncbi:MAG TPA: hypothetical protein VJ044_04035 [Candidatus Hodarchaeales archaeon]|nr:hypothetical protein [Candidatus Hodarchaeales archaeon]